MQTYLTQFVRGKTVSLVGAAESIIGTGNGKRIDESDVVIRIGITEPIPDSLKQYVGTRTDVIYFCLDDYAKYVRHGRYMDIPAVEKTPECQFALQEKYKLKDWIPLAGTTCLYTCLLSGAKNVYVSGVDFYRTGNRQMNGKTMSDRFEELKDGVYHNPKID